MKKPVKKDADSDKSELYYYDNGLLVMTEEYHKIRGYCCGSKCRHCPYDHINVPKTDS